MQKRTEGTLPFDRVGRTEHVFMPEDHMDELYNSGNPLVRFVHLSRLEAIVSQVPERERLTVLDAGCGEGHLLEKLHDRYPRYEFFGADVTNVALEKARERCPFTSFRKTNLMRTGFDDEAFDVVICTEVLEHIHEYEAVLGELKRIVKKGGLLILTFPNEFLWTLSRFLLGRRPVKVPDHVNSFTPRRMRGLVDFTLAAQWNLPFGFPFQLSLGCLMKFQKGSSEAAVLQPT